MIHIKGSHCNNFLCLDRHRSVFWRKNREKTIKRANSESLAVFKGGSLDRSKLSHRIGRAFREL